MTGFLASLHSKSRVLTLVDGFVGPNPGMLTAKLSGEAVGLCTIVRVKAGAFGDLGVSKN
jgi:hypothetical protein